MSNTQMNKTNVLTSIPQISSAPHSNGKPQKKPTESLNIRDAIPHGAKNAITAKELQVLLCYKNVRQVTLEIEELRHSGIAILAVNEGSRGNNGFFYPETIEEGIRHLQTMYSRMRKMNRTCSAVRTFIEESRSCDQILVIEYIESVSDTDVLH